MNPTARYIEGYVHNGRIGVLIEFGLESHLTPEMPEFRKLARDIALQATAVPSDNIETFLKHAFVKDESLTVRDVIAKTSRLLGENIVIMRYARWDTDDPLYDEPNPPHALAVRLQKVS